MSQTPFARAEGLRVGTVDFVSPNEVKVLLDIEAPESVALNVGGARPFPRVNGYVLIPVDDAYLVGQVEWITIERAAFPKRRGVRDFGVVDLPYPLRRMSTNPVGTLRKQAGPEDRYAFRRGADFLPSVGGAVILPTECQLRAIVESGERQRVPIGTSPLAANATVSIDPDRLFGRHLAVLGNTGSGKSCSVAGLIRWSLEAARQEKKKQDQEEEKWRPNARFIVLDPNGEYARAFDDGETGLKARVFRVNPESDEYLPLNVPLWFWNSAEWASFTQASAKTQRPLLRRALREVKAGRTALGATTEEERRLQLRRYLSSVLITIRKDLSTGAIRTDESKVGFRLRAIRDDLDTRNTEMPSLGLGAIRDAIDEALGVAYNSFEKNGETIEYYRAFNESQIEAVLDALQASLEQLGGIVYQEGPDEDVPLPFKGSDLADHIEVLAAQENLSQYLDFLVSRIRTFLSDSRINSVVSADGSGNLEQWLTGYIGADAAAKGEIAVLDLSLVPSDVIHVITAVTARMVFEALQRYRKLNGEVLPTVIVMEEAHTFVKRYTSDAENQDSAAICCKAFERISREGRKFGLGLVLSSQRPSELSPTVLSQCNTFLLHRISNDRDQELVNRLVPDNLRGLLRELPSLPSQHAILLGWASELPVLTRMRDLPPEQRPQSEDPDFWDVWTGKDRDGKPVERQVDWDAVAKDWQGDGVGQEASDSDGDGNDDTEE